MRASCYCTERAEGDLQELMDLNPIDIAATMQKATVSRGFSFGTAPRFSVAIFIVGGSAEIRTRDQRIKSPLLYRLSYRPVDLTQA